MSRTSKSANGHKDGGCPNHDPRIVIVFDAADPQEATNHKDGACPGGKDLRDLTRVVKVVEGRGRRSECLQQNIMLTSLCP